MTLQLQTTVQIGSLTKDAEDSAASADREWSRAFPNHYAATILLHLCPARTQKRWVDEPSAAAPAAAAAAAHATTPLETEERKIAIVCAR